MNYLKNFLFSAAIILVSSQAASSAEREDLYQSGRLAFEKKEYVLALMNLHAFYVLNEADLENYPDLKITLEEKIKAAQSILETAMASNPRITLTPEGVVLKTINGTIHGGISGTGKEIQDLIQSGKIDLESISRANNSLKSNEIQRGK